MKNMRLTMAALMLAAAAVFAFSGTATALVDGGKHDLRSGLVTFTLDFVCQPCHAPHNNTTAASADQPIWNRAINLTGDYTPYTSNTFDGGTASITGQDLLCLSCHDGTLALEAFGGSTEATTTMLTGALNLGQDLTDDHPVGFSYTTSQTNDSGLATLTAAETAGFVFFGLSDDVKCATCHDAHKTNVAGVDDNYFLRVALGTGFCENCHINK